MEQHREDIGTRKDLCLYRIQTAKDNLKAAKILFEAKEYKSANNRAYYVIVLEKHKNKTTNGKSAHKHSACLFSRNSQTLLKRLAG